MRAIFLSIVLFLSGPAAGQDLPKYQSNTVNDFAGLLDEASRADLHNQLTRLRQDTGLEMTVVTLHSQTLYWPDLRLETFATTLFNAWGIGDQTRNDGIMVLVLRQDRSMRIELGHGFGNQWDRAAARIIDQTFLPAFQRGEYQSGIIAGTQEVINNIALPFSRHLPAPETSQRSTEDYAIWGIVAAIFASVAGAPLIGRFLHRLKHCPRCNRRGLRRSTRHLTAATRNSPGEAEQTLYCTHCGFNQVSRYTIARKFRSNSSSGGGFGGGSSSGGGASGRW